MFHRQVLPKGILLLLYGLGFLFVSILGHTQQCLGAVFSCISTSLGQGTRESARDQTQLGKTQLEQGKRPTFRPITLAPRILNLPWVISRNDSLHTSAHRIQGNPRHPPDKNLLWG